MAQEFKFYKSADNLDLLLNIESDIETEFLSSNSIISFTETPKKRFKVVASIVFSQDIGMSVVPDEESFLDSVSVLLLYSSTSSRKRVSVEMKRKPAVNKNLHYECEVDIDPKEWFKFIDFQACLVRNNSVPEHDAYLTNKNSLVGSSKIAKLYLDPYVDPSGGDLDIEWAENSDKELIYWVDTSLRKLMLNSNMDPELKQLFGYKGKTGKRAQLRDALFAPIAADTWEWLAREALAQLTIQFTAEDEGEVLDIDDIDDTYKQVIINIAIALYGKNEDKAIKELKKNLSTPDDRITFLNRELPVAVQRLANLNQYYKKGLGVL